jgi:chromate transporter
MILTRRRRAIANSHARMNRSPATLLPPTVGFREALAVWARIGLLSFGGPAGQIALMHRELVERRRWISEARFLHALNYCMLLPGPEAQQLAIYIGWLLHRTWGGIVAGVLFVLPGALIILLLSMLYARFQQLPLMTALFFGLKAAVLAIVVEAVRRVGRRALKTVFMAVVAAASFLAIFVFKLPFPLIILAAGVAGALVYRLHPGFFPQAQSTGVDAAAENSVVDRMAASGQLEHARPNRLRSLRVILVCLLLWFAPLAWAAIAQGDSGVLVQQGIFFSQAAVVTFGGAYSVLSYVAQRAVDDFGWLRPGEMLDGLALAETTPGPLILVLQFVAYMGAYRHASGLSPEFAGLLGAAMALWVTFVPCFLWIFLGAPYLESLRKLQILNAAMASITAAVVGVILNLSVWFALHTLFAQTYVVNWGWLSVIIPEWQTVNVPALVLTIAAMIAMLRFKAGMPATLAACALAGLSWSLL